MRRWVQSEEPQEPVDPVLLNIVPPQPALSGPPQLYSRHASGHDRYYSSSGHSLTLFSNGYVPIAFDGTQALRVCWGVRFNPDAPYIRFGHGCWHRSYYKFNYKFSWFRLPDQFESRILPKNLVYRRGTESAGRRFCRFRSRSAWRSSPPRRCYSSRDHPHALGKRIIAAAHTCIM